MVDWKNVLLAVLVAYVVADICSAIILKRARPTLFRHFMDVARKERRKVLLSLLLAIAAGGLTYYLLQRQ